MKSIGQETVKLVWLSAEFLRIRFRPLIKDYWFYQILQYPSRFIRKYFDWREISRNGIFCREDELFMCSLFPKQILDRMIIELRPSTLIDIGCGTGQSLNYFIQNGIDAIGIEGSELAANCSENKDKIIIADLRRCIDLGRKFDVAYCFEVVEHIPPEFVEILVQNIAIHSNTIVMSHAKPGQGGEGHFNEQPSKYWIDRFVNLGYVLDEKLTSQLRATQEQFAENMLCFRK